MGRIRTQAPREGAKSFNVRVHPSKKALIEAIKQGGACHPDKCWHKVALFAIFQKWYPALQSNWLKVDAGHVSLRYKGWWYLADQARTAKESLLLFDKEKYDLIFPLPYTLNFRRQRMVGKKPNTEARVRLNIIRDNEPPEARRARADYKKDMHLRVVGYAMI